MSTAKRSAELKRITRIAALSFVYVLTQAVAGCGGSVIDNSTSTSTSTSEVQKYLSAPVSGGGFGIWQELGTYTIDNSKSTFTQATYGLSATQEGAQLNYSGSVAGLDRGLLSLGISYPSSSTTGNWAFVLANQEGGLLQLNGQPFVPLVAANDCPNYSSAKSFQFVVIPSLLTAGTSSTSNTWNSQYDPAYGREDISISGTTINFSNIELFNAAGTQLTSYQALSGTPSVMTSTSGACAQTFYGDNTVSVPEAITVTDPGQNQTTTPFSLVGVGATGLLVEDNERGTESTYQPYLGVGTYIGLPQPSNSLESSTLASAQYLGFIYGGGTNTANGFNTGWSSTVASFGFSSTPSTCASVATATSTMIYGGDFPGNNPAGAATQQANGGYGNCDVAIDLGQQDSANNGLYPNATVYLYGAPAPGASFVANSSGKTDTFHAVAIAGQLNGKYAIFLIGVDATTNQGWGIYLLQSN